MRWELDDNPTALAEYYQRQQGYNPNSLNTLATNTLGRNVGAVHATTNPGSGGGGGLPFFSKGATTAKAATGANMTGIPSVGVTAGIPTAAGAGGSGGLFGMSPGVTSGLIQGGLGLLGGVISGAGQGAMTEAQLKAAKELALRQEQLQREQLAQQGAATGLQASQQDPLAQQRSRQQQALMAAILPGLRNAAVSSNIPGMNQFMPQVSGGLRIPEGGFDPSTLSFFSPESRAASEGQYWRQAAPFTPPPDLSKVGYGAAGQGATDAASAYYKTAEEESKAKNAALMQALNVTTGSARAR